MKLYNVCITKFIQRMIYIVGKNIGKYGGAAVVAMDLIDSMINEQIEIGVINHGSRIPPKAKKKFNEIRRFKLPYVPKKNRYKNTKFGAVRYYLRNFRRYVEGKILEYRLAGNELDLIIFNDFFPSTRSVLEMRSNQCKIVQIIHISPSFLTEEGGINKAKEFISSYKDVDAVVFVSNQCKKEWLSYGELDGKNAFYIPNCANEDIHEAITANSKSDLRGKLNLQPDKFYLVSVATVKKRKGQDILINAASKLKEIAPNLEILLIGPGNGEYISNLKKQVDVENLEFVKFLGKKSNSMEFIYASDAFILTSRAEAFPLVLLESMILKTPVIASNVDGVPEMIEHDNTGLLFESENTEELIECFKTMYSNSKARKNYADQASDKYWNCFSKKHFTKRYVELIEKLLNQKRAGSTYI